MKTKFSKQQADYWNSYTKGIERLDLDKTVVAEKMELAFIKKITGPIKDKSILDLGCGTGRLALNLARNAKEVIGIDISSQSIKIANKTAKYYKMNNFHGIVGDFKNQGYKDRFDVVFAVNLIHHTDDLEAILNHIKISLKKGGRLIIFEMNPMNLLFIPFLISIGQIRSHLTYQYLRSNVFSLKHILVKNDFRVDRALKWSWLPTSLYNKSLVFMKVNETLNRIPLINQFNAFNILICKKNI